MKNEEYNIQGWKAELSQPVGGDIFQHSDTAPFFVRSDAIARFHYTLVNVFTDLRIFPMPLFSMMVLPANLSHHLAIVKFSVTL
jgi:hypothetical protein